MDSLDSFLVEYGEHHCDKVNVFLHLFCIPSIVMSVWGILYLVLGDSLSLVVSLSMAIYWSRFHLKTDVDCGLMTAGWMWGALFLVRYLYTSSEAGRWNWSLFFFFVSQWVFGWVFQLVGHEYFEKRSPVMTSDEKVAANAPVFITASVLRLFGWRKANFVLIDAEIQKRVAEWRKTEKVK